MSKKFKSLKRLLSKLLVLMMAVGIMTSGVSVIENLTFNDICMAKDSVNVHTDPIQIAVDTAVKDVNKDMSAGILPAAFTTEFNFIGYFQLLDKHGKPLANAPWQLRAGFYEEGYNGVDPTTITYGDILLSGESDADGYIIINNSKQIISEDYQYATNYLLVKFPEDTSELSAKGLRDDIYPTPGTRYFETQEYLTYQKKNFNPYQLNGYTLVGRSTTSNSDLDEPAKTIYGESRDDPFVIGIVGEFAITERFENKDTGGSLQADKTTTKLTSENFTSTLPPPTFSSEGIIYSLQGYYLNDETAMRSDYPVMINNVLDNQTIRYQYTGQYTLSFNPNGGTPTPPNQSLGFGERAAEPIIPTNMEHNFLGWYTDDGTKWDFGTSLMPANNMILHAKWDNTSYSITVEYMTRDGEPLSASINPSSIIMI